MKANNFISVTENSNSSTNQLINLDMKEEKGIQLNYSIERNRNRRSTERTVISNVESFERFNKLCKAGYYFRLYPYNHQITKEAYVWVFAVKSQSPTFDFKLLVNEEILNVIMGYLSTGELIDTINVNPENTEAFSNDFQNFPLALFQGEVNQGQKKMRNFSDISYSKYDQGMIIYKTGENEELRNYIDSLI